MSMHLYTDAEWDTLLHIIMTSDLDWDPTVLDHTIDDNANWFDAISELKENPHANLFDYFGDYCYCTLAQEHDLHFFDASDTKIEVAIKLCLDHCVYEANHCHLIANMETVMPHP
jgi:hypothetical protein